MTDRTRHRILRLATLNGEPVPRPAERLPLAPEAPLVVSFEGLTTEEQEKALAAFPGGARFVLIQRAG